MSKQPDNLSLNLSLNVAHNLQKLRARIEAACEDCGRDPGTVTLIGASKTKPAQLVQEAYKLGVCDFGENYVDEALVKIPACNLPDAHWHFIGRIQSNKTRLIAQHFTWVHTLDRTKIANRLAAHLASADASKQLNVLIQVNVDQDPNKAGVALADAPAMLAAISALPALRPRGLMTILDPASDARASYASVAQLAADLAAMLPAEQRTHWNCLSMGMSGDLEAAIGAGATHVRIGTDLFGARDTV